MKSHVLSLSLLACFATAAFAQAPVNDLCSGATPLVVGANVGTTTGSNAEGPACGAGFLATVKDVFYTYTPAVDEACTLNLTSGNVDRGAVFVGSCGSLTAVSCTVAATVSTTIPLTWFAQAGVTYTIRLGRVSATLGTFTVTLVTAAPLANDDCASPTVLADGINPSAPLGVSGTFFTNVGATTSINQGIVCVAGGTYGAGAFDVWYQYTAAVSGPTTIQTCTPAGFTAGTHADTNLQVFTGSCGFLTEVVCDTDSCVTPNFNSLLSLNAVSGTTYTIRLTGFSATATSTSGRGTYYLTVSPPVPPPANDDCFGATSLSVGPNVGTTAGALVSADPVGICTGFTGTTIDTWHTFTVGAGCTAIITRTGAGANQLGLYAGSCGALSAVACGTTSVAAVIAAGTYYVRVGQTTPASAGAYSLDFQCVAPPANDDCLSAAAASLGANAGSTGGSTTSAEPVGSCAGFTPTVIDVWYSFTPAVNGTFSASTVGTGASQIGIYDAGMGCGGPSLACGATTVTPFAVVGGQPLLIRVGSTFASQGSFTLNLFLLTNDTCATPIPVVIGSNGPFSNIGAAPGNEPGFTSASCGFGGNAGGSDVFFTFVATCDATLTATTCGGNAVNEPGVLSDTQITAYDSWTCGVANNLVACNDDGEPTSPFVNCGANGFESRVTFSVLNGQQYLIRVAGFGGGTGSFVLKLSQTTAQKVDIGAGCPVTTTLSGDVLPVMGTTGTITVTAQPNANGVLLFSNPNTAMAYTPFGACTIYVQNPGMGILLPIFTDGAGVWSLTATFPTDPAFDCVGWDFQALVIGAAGIEFTNALRLIIGT